MNDWVRVLTVVAAMGAGIVGGVFFGFSTFIMRALGQLPDQQGLAAMQSINREAPSPVFMAAFVGTAALSVGTTAVGLGRLGEPDAVYLLVGGALYLAGFVLTVDFHVPRNDALQRVDPAGAGAPTAWRRFHREWTAANHVRTLTSVAASLAFTVALFVD